MMSGGKPPLITMRPSLVSSNLLLNGFQAAPAALKSQSLMVGKGGLPPLGFFTFD